MDVTQLILDDHHEQRRLFAILEQVDRSDTGTLSAIWGRLAAFLELHAAAEEAIFYPALLQVGIARRRKGEVEDETLDAIHDHNEIRDAVADVARHAVGSDGWYAAVAGANLANSDHMAEEEREGLTDFRRLTGLQQRHDLAAAFAAYEARNFAGVQPVDKDPAAYVSQTEKGTGQAGDGSLGIGGFGRPGALSQNHLPPRVPTIRATMLDRSCGHGSSCDRRVWVSPCSRRRRSRWTRAACPPQVDRAATARR